MTSAVYGGCIALNQTNKQKLKDCHAVSFFCFICLPQMVLEKFKAVTAQLNCVFVFAYAKRRFSDYAAHIVNVLSLCMFSQRNKLEGSKLNDEERQKYQERIGNLERDIIQKEDHIDCNKILLDELRQKVDAEMRNTNNLKQGMVVKVDLEKLSLACPTRLVTNRSVQPQKMARGLKFGI